MMDAPEASAGFAAVGSVPRLRLLILLVRAGPDGLTTGQVQERLGIPASTLAHHLRILADAGAIRQEKKGRAVINTADYDRLRELAEFLLKECCEDATLTRHREHEHG
ncbi:MAG: ArsR/SmtB family transcription factor [Paracoccaceae bacterium]